MKCILRAIWIPPSSRPWWCHPFCVFQETRTLAEIAKAELDGSVLKNRQIRVSFATHTAALTVRNLLPSVTNELLEQVSSDIAQDRHCFDKVSSLFLLLLWNLLIAAL